MSISIKIYNKSDETNWDDFVSEAKNATFLHSRKFFKHNKLNEQDDCSLMFYKEKELIAVFPANLYSKDNKNILNSYLRSTYGGLIYSDKTSMMDLITIVQLLIQYAKENNIQEIIIRPSFKIYHKNLSDDFIYALSLHGFETKYKEIELAINLEQPIGELYSDNNKRNIKKAKKQNIIINESGNLQEFWTVLTDNLELKHQVKPVHNFEEITALINLVGQEKIKAFTAELNNETIAGILVFIANQRVAHAQYIASNDAYQSIRPLNLLIDYIANWAQINNFKYFNLGMACEPGGKTINEGLYKFKEGFGARGTLRETFSLNIT